MAHRKQKHLGQATTEWVFFSINEGGKKPKAVPVSFDDAYLLGVYALDVFARNYPNIDSHCLLNTVQTFTQLPYYPVQQ